MALIVQMSNVEQTISRISARIIDFRARRELTVTKNEISQQIIMVDYDDYSDYSRLFPIILLSN